MSKETVTTESIEINLKEIKGLLKLTTHSKNPAKVEILEDACCVKATLDSWKKLIEFIKSNEKLAKPNNGQAKKPYYENDHFQVFYYDHNNKAFFRFKAKNNRGTFQYKPCGYCGYGVFEDCQSEWINEDNPSSWKIVFDSLNGKIKECEKPVEQKEDSGKNNDLEGVPLLDAELCKHLQNGKMVRNLILQGPPGTGKTHSAHDIAICLIDDANVKDHNDLKNTDRFKMVQFHPATTYEDFVRGIRAKTVTDGENKTVSYGVEHGALSGICDEAKKPENADKNYVLIIDEINRANLPAVLGESIFALEWRGNEVDTPYAIDEGKGKRLIIPENLWIIGTMNTADRSIGHLDYAVRRRFIFVDCPAKESDISDTAAKACFNDVNTRIINRENVSDDFAVEDVKIGHTFFIKDDWKMRLEYQVKPLLKEYIRDGILENVKEDDIDKLSSIK